MGILEWQQKTAQKHYILPPPLTFFGKSKTKNRKITVEFKMVKSLNTRFLKKKKDSILNSSIKKQTLSFTQKKIQKKANSIYLHAKIALLLNKKKVKKKKKKKTPPPQRKKKKKKKKKK